MKKGHRRTNSQTIGLCRPLQSKIERLLLNQQLLYEPKFSSEIISFPNKKCASIQSLLQKSENHIAQRVLYIQNLQQPNNTENNHNEFAFGKGVNYKLSNFKLNMGQIPQVPKSNQSTSLQGQNKTQILQKQLYFTHEPIESIIPSHPKLHKQLHRTPKFQPKHIKTSSAVGMKKIGKIQKNQKTDVKNEIKSFRQINLKDNPLKRPKFDYQIPKKYEASIKDQSQLQQTAHKNAKQILLDRFDVGTHKKKRINQMK